VKHDNRCELISYAIENGSKLYKVAFGYFCADIRFDLNEALFDLPDIFAYETPRDYLFTVFSADRHYNMYPTDVTGKIQYLGISAVVSVFSGCVTPENLLFFACETGNTDHLSRALILGLTLIKLLYVQLKRRVIKTLLKYLWKGGN
jgi:hypothetical protein